ncbi:unnamed protein product [Ostreobium quekettii]|uniref:Galactokinase N-terminal domain-containing protein n=1 Tax=Ostreobium quekettii TaxID=121088 RepID=A0A8S1J6F4_9CHLO|nr:unnamed protein product [Ostreobium quekettii]
MQESSGAAPQRPLTGLTGSTDCLQSADAREFLAALDAIPEPHSRAIDPGADIFVARAPGRLDVFGGFADYSGSMALQMPTAEACFAAAQVSGRFDRWHRDEILGLKFPEKRDLFDGFWMESFVRNPASCRNPVFEIACETRFLSLHFAEDLRLKLRATNDAFDHSWLKSFD